ncbi:DUF3099 domain-containing protein [Streptomyces sp. P9-2B-2]|uniref:DUF3099 domain-containing protein n=1 Tax=Streptomyces sp. P9-2B-2 TaxID=3057114 RepID=UPI0025B581B1|nr:DUF3099 domain-containing protein [Streptomyces sp. P9-2B-2]WJY37515.1 DUF3099 domain-containing protein [Streptomyces sp. P9-2B-2]
MRKQNSGQTFRITGARQGLSEDVRGRQRRYVISMVVRTVAVVLTVVLWNIERPVAIATLVLGLALPYIAVVIANAGRENVPSLPKTFVAGPTRTMLTPGASDTPAESVPERPAAGASESQHDPS